MSGSSATWVALDLSACAMADGATEFDPEPAKSDQKEKIVSLVLPNAVRRIAGNGSSSAFTGFTITAVSGANVEEIGDYAFANRSFLITASFPKATDIGKDAFYFCFALTTASFPEATDIGEQAFFYCNNLTTVSFPEATDIGAGAFGGCTALTTASFPEATDIGEQAFDGCYNLTTASFPKATDIGRRAFRGTGITKALTITLDNTAPALGTDMFSNVPSEGTGTKTVIVKVPSGATGYGSSPTDTTTGNWGNGFRGGGWNGSAMTDSSKVNSSISLTIETIP
jgi:hypothetical protein